MAADTRRLSILSAEEIVALYDLPRFDANERQFYFDFSPSERAAIDAIHTRTAAIHLALQLGYFKAKRRFFIIDPSIVTADVAHLVQQYFPDCQAIKLKPLTKPTRLEQQRIILTLFNCRLCGQPEKMALEGKAQRCAMLSTQPVFIIRELLQYLEGERLVIPGYTTLQEIVGRAVSGERRRITKLLGDSMTSEVKGQLDALLHADDFVFRISALKREARDFSYGELKREVERRQIFQPLHDFAKNFLTQAGLSVESGKYYASLVKFYTVYKLQRMAPETTRLYLLCFAYHCFRQINDNLIDAFLHLVHQYESHAKRAAEEAMQKALADTSENLEAAGEVLNLFADAEIPDDTPFEAVKERAFTFLDAEQIPVVANYLRNIAFDKRGFEWSYYTALSMTIKRNLRHLFCELDFAGRVENAPLMEAIIFLQDLLRQGKVPRQVKSERFPVTVIPSALRRYLYHEAPPDQAKSDAPAEPRLDADRYEFLLYRLLRKELEAGNIYVKDSHEHRRFEDDLISDERWANRDEILREIGAPLLLAPIKETLGNLRQQLEDKIKSVNLRISDAMNEHIKVRGKGEKRRWTLIYPTSKEPDNSPFYARLPGLPVTDMLWFGARETGFLSAFTHVLDRYAKQVPSPRELLAVIIGMGTNMGLGKMAEVSGLSHAALMNAARSYLRQETVHAANDAISNATARLPAFQLYNIRDAIHSSSDGQRFQTQTDTINARYSPKYFGLEKGVSANTLVVNNVPVNAKVIGTHEHESHYVFDLLYNNTSDIGYFCPTPRKGKN
jgi:hypothetical protein